MRGGLLAGLVVVALVGAACGDDDDADSAPTSGPVTIESEVDFTGDMPIGSFEVTEGADVLGCAAGTFTDPGRTDEGVTNILICESCSRGGSFSILFDLQENAAVPGEFAAPWSITASTQDFVGLQGEGDMSFTFESETTGISTFTGTIEFGP